MFRKKMSSAAAQFTLAAALLIASPSLTKAAVLGGTIGHAERLGTTLSGQGLFSHPLDWLWALSHGPTLPRKDSGVSVDPNGVPKPNAVSHTLVSPTALPTRNR
jgi:hypothetical protein